MSGGALPTFKTPPVKSGEKTRITISLLNDSDENVSGALTATDLLSRSADDSAYQRGVYSFGGRRSGARIF